MSVSCHLILISNFKCMSIVFVLIGEMWNINAQNNTSTSLYSVYFNYCAINRIWNFDMIIGFHLLISKFYFKNINLQIILTRYRMVGLKFLLTFNKWFLILWYLLAFDVYLHFYMAFLSVRTNIYAWWTVDIHRKEKQFKKLAFKCLNEIKEWTEETSNMTNA